MTPIETLLEQCQKALHNVSTDAEFQILAYEVCAQVHNALRAVDEHRANGAQDVVAQLIADLDIITVKLMRRVPIDKHQARDCAKVVVELLKAAPQPQETKP